MHLNKITLIGFLGNDAEVRHTHQGSPVVTLSLATKSASKQNGQYTSRTEWHRLVVFGKLAEFASTLKKGAHLHIEGPIQSRTYDDKRTGSERTVWEVHVRSILKLDRADRDAADDSSTEPFTAEEVAF